MRRSRRLFPDVVERQCAVPLKRLPDPFDGFADLGAEDADLEHVATAGSFHYLPVDMAGDEPSAIEHRLRALERARNRGLYQQAISECIVGFELSEQRVALARVGHAPDPAARGAEGSLDEKWIGPVGRKLLRRANDLGCGLLYVQLRQQCRKAGLAL